MRLFQYRDDLRVNGIPSPTASFIPIQVSEKEHLLLYAPLNDTVCLAARPQRNVRFPVFDGTGKPQETIMLLAEGLVLPHGTPEQLQEYRLVDTNLAG